MDSPIPEWQGLANAIDELYSFSAPSSKKRDRKVARSGSAPRLSFESISQDFVSLSRDGSEPDVWRIFAYRIDGSDPDFKKYLPWFLEQIGVSGGFGYETGLIFRKFSDAHLSKWHELERQAIENYAIAFWKDYLTSLHYTDEPSPIIYCFSFVFTGIAPLLDVWEEYLRAGRQIPMQRLLTQLEWGWPDTDNYDPFATSDAETLAEFTAVREARKQVYNWMIGLRQSRMFEGLLSTTEDESCWDLSERIVYYLQRLSPL